MYAIKEAVIAKEHQSIIEPTIFYMDIRAFGKGFDDYYERSKQHGVRFVRSIPSKLIEDPLTHNLEMTYVGDDGKPCMEEFDMVVLSVGLRPKAGTDALAARLGVELNTHGFVKTDPFNPVKTSQPGVFVCGAFQAPKDIPETVAQASSAIAWAETQIHLGRNTRVHVQELPPERDVNNEEPRIGVFVCHCGVNIGSVINVPEVVEYAKSLPFVVHTEHNLFTCSQDTQEIMKKTIEKHRLNRVIVSSCSPRTHEKLFQLTLRQAGLNPYLFDMANIRDQCSWVHMDDKDGSTQKAKDLIRMTVANSALQHSLRQHQVPVCHHALVIGCGLAGMSSALQLATQGFSSTLIDRADKPGGNMHHIHKTIDGADVQAKLKELTKKIEQSDKIEILLGVELTHYAGAKGNFQSTVTRTDNGQEQIIEHGVTIVATGAVERKPVGEYLYGENDRVVTGQDFSEKYHEPQSFDGVRQVVMIQCVGSRCEDRPNCSRICCSTAIKNALTIKAVDPSIQVNIIARDIRTYGFLEEYYTQARKAGVRFTRYTPDNPPWVVERDDRLEISVLDRVLGENVHFPADLLVLSSAIVPANDQELARLMRLPRTLDGFFLESHQKLGPVDFAVDGVYLAGMAHGPKLLSETAAQAAAAVARAATVLSKERLTASGVVSEVDPDRCAVCLTCVRVCPYDVPVVGANGTAEIDPIQCRGCGSCAAECPGLAIELKHFRDDQLIAKSTALTKQPNQTQMRNES
jgi:heterodisulfide reductase subunit A